ncbi:adenosine receptor A1-like [Ornithodoros turicata]|uniref:adenosine receptor A1-like n=1 Tax=Ornithodoros turicata TaxID=34597 RepID=UPI00313A39BA
MAEHQSTSFTMSPPNWTDFRNYLNVTVPEHVDIARDVYRHAIPVMLGACLTTMLFNLLILESVHWVRRSLSPTLCFSLSLSVANAYASLVVGVGLIVNSLLPTVYDVEPGLCISLTLEAFRLTGLIASVLHLLALAINHYIGILRPLHYAATVTKRTVGLAIASMWLLPLAFFFIYFCSVPGQGFQSRDCLYDFILCSPFRITLSGLFFFPLVMMTLIYGHIFIVVRRHQRGAGIAVSLPGQLRRSIKAMVTTLLILGTYLLGWVPAVIFYVLTCLDCALPIISLPLDVRLTFGILTNSLVLLKSLADPVIYVVRMPEIQSAFRLMWLSRCGLLQLPRAGSEMTRMQTRMTDTKRSFNGIGSTKSRSKR